METEIKTSNRGTYWIAIRGLLVGHGKTKKKAIADLQETERFQTIATYGAKGHYFLNK